MHFYSRCEIEILFFFFSSDIANFLEEIDILQEGTLTEQQNAFDLLNYKRQKVGIQGNRNSLVVCKESFLCKKTNLWWHSTKMDNFMIFHTFIQTNTSRWLIVAMENFYLVARNSFNFEIGKNQLSIITLSVTILLEQVWKIMAKFAFA